MRVCSVQRVHLSALAAGILAHALLGCGARSELEIPSATTVAAEDLCRAAVSGPKAMVGNCSTRDGRSRVGAPAAPHVTWTTQLGAMPSEIVGFNAVATDATGNAYVTSLTATLSGAATLWRVDTTDGTIDWMASVSPGGATGVPIVLSQGGVELLASTAGGDPQESLLIFDATTGASTATQIAVPGLELVPPAVGVDGSLYLARDHGDGSAVARVDPSGKTLWSSAPPGSPSLAFGAPIALGEGDVVVTIGLVPESIPQLLANAQDPATGATLWSTQLAGQLVGGPVVRSDGTIVALIDADPGLSLVVLDPHNGAPSMSPVSADAFQIIGVTKNGVVIGGGDMGSGSAQLVALADDGTVLWTHDGGGNATIASDGTVVAFGPTAGVTAIDGATGKTKWVLQPPVATCIADGALTSTGGIVALQCDGTLFGASD